MILRYITMSDPRSNLPLDKALNLLAMSPKAEFGIQAHPSAMSAGKPRNVWVNDLIDVIERLNTNPNLALHVNYEWCDEMTSGKIPQEIAGWLIRKHPITHKPIFGRVQLNIGDGTKNINPEKLASLISQYANREFILPYNMRTKPQIESLRAHTNKFTLLFDSSYGIGVSPARWSAPVYSDIQFGYAGGLSPNNVESNLKEISNVVPQDYSTWIDAEGRLRSARNGWSFDADLAYNYLTNVMKWDKER